MSLKNIFQKPQFVHEFGEVYPVCLKDWDLFEENVRPILFSKKHLELNVEEDIPLLDRLTLGLQSDELIESMCIIFNIVSRSDTFELHVTSEKYWFENDKSQIINSLNYDELRNIILNQNILFEPKVYKNPMVQQWAEKVLEARNKNAANITMETIITTVASFSGKHYWDLEKYSIYQIKSEFQRINKIKIYDTTSIAYANPYASDIKLDHFAEFVDLYEDPYQDVFKEKSKMNISKAIKG